MALLLSLINPLHADAPQPERTTEHVTLKRGDFTFYLYSPGQPEFKVHPRALLIFGSGDGGPLDFEDKVCRHLQSVGCIVISFDCAEYAKTDYDLDMLQADTDTLARSQLARYGDHAPPLIVGGWSMGAEQAIPMAGGPHRPNGLVGVLVLSPGSRGRYGLREADRWDVPPTGPGTFALADFAQSLDGLRVVQWTGGLDLVSSTTWLRSLTAVHQANMFHYALHDFNGAPAAFLKNLEDSLDWILTPPPSAPRPPALD